MECYIKVAPKDCSPRLEVHQECCYRSKEADLDSIGAVYIGKSKSLVVYSALQKNVSALWVTLESKIETPLVLAKDLVARKNLGNIQFAS